MPDAFSSHSRSPSGPATSVFSIAPDDAADLAQVTIALNAATPGTVRVTTADGSVGDLMIAAGEVIPLRVRRVWATGTTATGLRGLA
jgi:hypothetical protein